jgi:hypothetical protein
MITLPWSGSGRFGLDTQQREEYEPVEKPVRL